MLWCLELHCTGGAFKVDGSFSNVEHLFDSFSLTPSIIVFHTTGSMATIDRPFELVAHSMY